MVTSVLRAEVEIWPFRACAMENTRSASGHNNRNSMLSLWTWLWGRYHASQNVFLANNNNNNISDPPTREYSVPLTR